jgi:hypothetical protein
MVPLIIFIYYFFYRVYSCWLLVRPYFKSMHLPLEAIKNLSLLRGETRNKLREKSRVLASTLKAGLRILNYGSGSSISCWIPIRIQIRIRIQIQSGSRGFDDQKLKKIYSWKKLHWSYIKNYNLPIPRPHKGRPRYKRSLQLSKRTSSTSKHEISSIFFYFCGSFLPSWIRIQLGSGSGSETLIKSTQEWDIYIQSLKKSLCVQILFRIWTQFSFSAGRQGIK